MQCISGIYIFLHKQNGKPSFFLVKILSLLLSHVQEVGGSSSALSLVWVGLLGRVSLLQILTKYWSQYCSMVKLYNFHLGSHQCPPLTVTPGACSRDQRCTRLGFCLCFGLADLNNFLTPQISDQVTAVTAAMNERDRTWDRQTCLESATQQYYSIVPTTYMFNVLVLHGKTAELLYCLLDTSPANCSLPQPG